MEASVLATTQLVFFEREKIFQFVGSDEAKFRFLESNPEIAFFRKEYTVFNRSGLFQLKDGPPILVLPWFLKDLDLNEKRNSFLGFFETVRDITRIKDSFNDISIQDSSPIAMEVLVYSFLIKVDERLDYFLAKNHYTGISEKTRTVKGKWDLQKDLRKTDRPITFSCSYGSFDSNITFLKFLKSFLIELKAFLRTSKSLAFTDRILSKLQSIEYRKLNIPLVKEAVIDLQKRNFSNEWSFSINFAYEILTNQFEPVRGGGICYTFRLDKFFEELVANILRRGDGYTIEQKREDIFGGAKWTNGTQSEDEIVEDIRAKMYSVPDLIFYNDETYNVIECKYKPFALPIVGTKSDITIPYSRDDRNQLLSFLLALKPSPMLAKRKITFNVVYPTYDHEDFSAVSLRFDHASFKIDAAVKTIVQKISNFESEVSFTVKYIGINIPYYIQCLRNNESLLGFFEQLSNVEDSVASQVTAERLTEKNLKRAATACLVVEELKKDNTLGRTKMAKVLYLLDTHFNLDISNSYYRAAAGPLDQDMIYGKEDSVEALCTKQSYFQVTEKRNDEKIERIKYVPGVNLQYGIEKSKQLFFGKQEDMKDLVRKVSILDTERIEIVATLYACWNDLILEGNMIPEDEKIIDDFYNRWHPAKKRFLRDRLVKALQWMREQRIAPFGNGKSTRVF